MPIAVGNGSRVAQVSGNRRTKLEEPAPYALVGNIQTPLRKEILHIPIAQSEPGIEPNGASNDFRWKAVTFEGDGVHPKRLHRNHQIEIRALNVTMPGWGGLGGYRDCSSTILDVFLPFALPLPRNSRSQAGAGRNVTIEQLSPAEKRERILIEAVPFRTILNLDGHNMLYLGVFEGSPVAFHTIWGLRTESADESRAGRHLIFRFLFLENPVPDLCLFDSGPTRIYRKEVTLLSFLPAWGRVMIRGGSNLYFKGGV